MSGVKHGQRLVWDPSAQAALRGAEDGGEAIDPCAWGAAPLNKKPFSFMRRRRHGIRSCMTPSEIKQVRELFADVLTAADTATYAGRLEDAETLLREASDILYGPHWRQIRQRRSGDRLLDSFERYFAARKCLN